MAPTAQDGACNEHVAPTGQRRLRFPAFNSIIYTVFYLILNDRQKIVEMWSTFTLVKAQESVLPSSDGGKDAAVVSRV